MLLTLVSFVIYVLLIIYPHRLRYEHQQVIYPRIFLSTEMSATETITEIIEDGGIDNPVALQVRCLSVTKCDKLIIEFIYLIYNFLLQLILKIGHTKF